MLKALIQKATDAIASRRGMAPEPLPAQEEQLPVSWAEARKAPAPVAAPTDALDMIVVPQSALDAFPENPRPLVDAVVAYVNFLLHEGRMHPSEIPAEAIQAYRCDSYHAQVCDGGHVQYVDRNADMLTAIISDLMGGLIGMGDAKYQRIAGDMATFVGSHKVTDKAAALARLDQPFYVHDKKVRFTMVLAEWLADCEILLTVPDALLTDVYRALVAGRAAPAVAEDAPETPEVSEAPDVASALAPMVLGRMAQFADMLKDSRKLGFGLAGGSDKNPLVGLGGTLKMDVDGRMVDTTFVYAAEGECWAVLTEEGACLRERLIDDESESAIVGEILSQADIEDIQTVRELCHELQAAAAIDLLLTTHDPDLDVDYLSVHDIIGDDPQDPSLMIYVVYAGGAAAFTARIDAAGATLLDEPTHEELVVIARDEIAEYAQTDRQSVAA